MLKSYLEVNDTCTVAGQELVHHPAAVMDHALS